MNTYLFYDDYSEGAHPRILDALARTNLQQARGYGEDVFAKDAERLIRAAIGQPDAQVHFVTSGTHANLICLASMLKPYESVIAPDNGHVFVHESGAIEATGHRITTVPGVDGKLTPDAVRAVLATHTNEHTVQPRVVYISQATECGTIYSKQELRDLHALCQQRGLYLYIDGARIGNAVVALQADADLRDIAACCDMFYIGGTKNGALLGEGIIIVNPALQHKFRNHLRQRGGLLAKARAVTVQFAELFADTLYFDNARHANTMAHQLATGITACGYKLLHEPVINQVFAIMPNSVIAQLEQQFGFYVWAKRDDDCSVIRLVTSWATTEEAVEGFVAGLKLVVE